MMNYYYVELRKLKAQLIAKSYKTAEEFICKLGTEIVAQTLHYCFNCGTIVADSAIELNEICLLHTYILCSFLLFFYPFLVLICIFNKLLSLAQVGLVSEEGAQTKMARMSLEKLKAEMIIVEEKPIKNRYMKRLGITVATLAALTI